VTSKADRPSWSIHPLHAVFLAATLPLFFGGLLCDWTYARDYQVQWNNFAAWIIAAAMIFTGLALLWSLIAVLRGGRGRSLVGFILLLAMFVLGLVNSFVHARDAYGTMPDGLMLSLIVTVLAIVAVWTGFSTLGSRDAA
jgi:uncharacterized membrane protein